MVYKFYIQVLYTYPCEVLASLCVSSFGPILKRTHRNQEIKADRKDGNESSDKCLARYYQK